MNWLSAVLGLLQLAPSIVQLIVQIEQLFGAGNGVDKKAIVMSTVSSAPTAVQSTVSTFTDGVVSAANKAGVFKKSS